MQNIICAIVIITLIVQLAFEIKSYHEEKVIRKTLGKYPCIDFLYDTLHYIEIGDPDVAYTEICWAIMKSGLTLRPEACKRFYEIRSKENDWLSLCTYYYNDIK